MNPAQIIEHENLIEITKRKGGAYTISFVEKNYPKLKKEILLELLIQSIGVKESKDDLLEVTMKHIDGITTNIKCMLDAHEELGTSPIINGNCNRTKKVGRDLYNQCSRLVRIYNSENM